MTCVMSCVSPVARCSTAHIFPSRRAPVWMGRSNDSPCAGPGTGTEWGCVNGEQLAERGRVKIFERFCAATILAPRWVWLSRRRLTSLLAACVGLLSFSAGAAAQPAILRRLNFDRLQLAALGASAGAIQISQVNRTTIYAIGADYGEIAPEWRVVFGVSYWSSRYADE